MTAELATPIGEGMGVGRGGCGFCPPDAPCTAAGSWAWCKVTGLTLNEGDRSRSGGGKSHVTLLMHSFLGFAAVHATGAPHDAGSTFQETLQERAAAGGNCGGNQEPARRDGSPPAPYRFGPDRQRAGEVSR